MTRAWVSSSTNFEQATVELREHLRTGKGAIAACAHLGSWDLTGAAGHLLGIPVFSIAGRQRNPLFNDYLNRLRERGGIKILIRGSSTLKAVLQELKSGKVLAILSDVRMPTPGLPIRLFGKTANIGPGMASFAYHAKVPIFPVIARREGWSRHSFRLGPVLHPDGTADKKLEILRLTQRVFDIVESAIRESPDQWFWFNKRWILEPLPTESPPGPELPAVDGELSI
jgi:KDO2-lipid IV(A) lauroyltransferase